MAGRQVFSVLYRSIAGARSTVFSDLVGRRVSNVDSQRNTVFSDSSERKFSIASNRRNTIFSDSSERRFGVASHRNNGFSDVFRRGFSVSSSSFMGRALVNWETKGDVAVVRVNDPNSKVNTWSVQMQKEMMEVMDEIWTNDALKSTVVISSKPGSFISMADKNPILACKTAKEATLLSQEWQKMMERIEKSPKPIVAAINGKCLGAGLEFAIACQYRVASRYRSTYFSSPEVNLDLLPSAGGTQRLPQLVGLHNALDLLLFARKVCPEKAKKLGLVDQMVIMPGLGFEISEESTIKHLEEVAVDYAQRIVNKEIPLTKEQNWKKKIVDNINSSPSAREKIYNKWRTIIRTKEKPMASLGIIESVKAGIEQGPQVGYRLESLFFGELAMDSETKHYLESKMEKQNLTQEDSSGWVEMLSLFTFILLALFFPF